MASFQPVRLLAQFKGTDQQALIGEYMTVTVSADEVVVYPGREVVLKRDDDGWVAVGSKAAELVEWATRVEWFEVTTFRS